MKVVCISLLFITLSATCFAQKSVDASQFDVAGVKLGMNMEEAKAAAAKHMDVYMIAVEMGGKYKNDITKTLEHQSFIIKLGGSTPASFTKKLEVVLLPDPLSEGESRVYMIKYEIPHTENNEQAMKQAGINKYGPVSNSSLDSADQLSTSKNPLRWCQSINTDTPELSCTNYQEAVLEISGSTLVLMNIEAKKNLNAWREEQKSVTPSF